VKQTSGGETAPYRYGTWVPYWKGHPVGPEEETEAEIMRKKEKSGAIV